MKPSFRSKGMDVKEKAKNRIGELIKMRQQVVDEGNRQVEKINVVMIEIATLAELPELLPEELRPKPQSAASQLEVKS
jgi:hypothetical protein